MKLNFSKSIGRLRTELLLLLVGFILSPLMVLGTDPIYINTGTINNNNLPQVDATTFYNSGNWNISTIAPYETANTFNYTNVGTMIGSVGWEFDLGPSGGPRRMAANFFNDTPGTIQATDGTIGNPPTYASFLASYLLVSATNLVNKGMLIAGGNGQIILTGSNVILSRSKIQITPIQGLGSSSAVSNFTPDVAVYSLFWKTNGMNLVSQSLWNGADVFANGTNLAPFSFVVDGNTFNIPSSSNISNVFSINNVSSACGVSNFAVQFVPFIPAPGSDSTNLVPLIGGMTNFTYTNSGGTIVNTGLLAKVIRHAVFLNIEDTNITGQVRFSPSSNTSNNFQTVAVRFTATSTNPITQLPQTAAIYLADTLASETNSGLTPSAATLDPFYQCTGPVRRPANYNVSRTDPIVTSTGLSAFGSGVPGSGLPPADFFYSPPVGNISFSNSVVQAHYAAYATLVDNLTSDQQAGTVVTNLGGRIIINANNLDLSRAGLSAQGDIMIRATNLISSAGAVVDCQNLDYNLGSTNGNLNFTNLANLVVSRFHGNIAVWSSTWTNYMYETFQSYSTNNGVWTPATVTNATEMDLYAMFVDASSLSSHAPVTVQNLTLHSTNMVVSDSMNVAQTLLFDGRSLTLLGSLTLSGSLQNWGSTIAPTLQYFTNKGFLSIPNNAHFGDDTTVPYAEFINQGVGSSTNLSGVIVSAGQTIRSLDLQITNGINYAVVGNFSATARSIEITGPPPSSALFPLFNALVSQFGFSIFNNGQIINALINNATIYAARDIQFFANTVLIDPAAFYANGALNFTVTNSLSDNGAANTFVCQNGFNLWIKPQTGDLLGTTITSVAPGNAEVDHLWAGNDLGPVAAGFSNNVAVGRLVLSAQSPSSLPLFRFSGTTGNNAMYVAMLDLSQLTPNSGDVASMIQIDPGMKIYFSQVILGFTPPGGQTPEDFLQAQFPGQFIKSSNVVIAQTGSADWNTVYQTIDGFGASSAWRSTWNTNLADMFFSTNSGTGTSRDGSTNYAFTGIGLSLLRNHIYPAGSTSASDTPSTTETSIMQMAQARGAKVWSAPWTSAAGFKDSGVWDGGNFVGNPANYQAYASQLANYVVSMKNQGINLYAISVQNEPDSNHPDPGGYESCIWNEQQIHDFIPYLYNALIASNVGSTKIMIPEGQSWQGSSHLFSIAMSDSTSNMVGIIADHNYNTTPPSGIPIQLATSGKPAWETETAILSPSGFNDPSIANGMYWAGRIHLFLTVAQASAWHYWWLISGNSTGNQGLADTNDIPAKRMYVLGQFSRFVRPGYERISVNTSGSSLLVTAFKATNSPNFAIVAINTNSSFDVSQTFSLTNFPAVSAVTPWITSSTNSLAVQTPVTVTGSSFTYTIPAQSVVTFVGQGNVAPSIIISSTSYNPGGPSFVLTWNSTASATYSVHKTNVLGGSAVSWPAIVTGYPVGGALGGPLSYTDITATVSPAFYRVSSP